MAAPLALASTSSGARVEDEVGSCEALALFAKLKYGDVEAVRGLAERTARRIAEGMQERWCEVVLSPPYRNVPTAAALWAREVHARMPAGVAFAQLRRGAVDAGEGGAPEFAAMGSEERERALPEFWLSDDDKGRLAGRRVVALDDCRITGAHERRASAAAYAAGASEVVHVYVYAPTEEAVQEHASRGVALEDFLNRVFVTPDDGGAMFGGWEDLQRSLAHASFAWTIRPVKWLLRRPPWQLAAVLAYLRDFRPDLLTAFHAAASAEGLS